MTATAIPKKQYTSKSQRQVNPPILMIRKEYYGGEFDLPTWKGDFTSATITKCMQARYFRLHFRSSEWISGFLTNSMFYSMIVEDHTGSSFIASWTLSRILDASVVENPPERRLKSLMQTQGGYLVARRLIGLLGEGESAKG
jgi:hypothetical protein